MNRPEPAERLVFSSVVEGLLKHGLGSEVSPALRQRLKAEGIDLDRPLLPAYPVKAWERCLRHIVDSAYPHLASEQGFRRLGKQMADGYAQTLIGRALYAVMRLIGPNRTLKRMAQNLGSSDNYTNVTLVELEPTVFDMRLNSRMEVRGYAEGLFAAMLEIAGARQVSVEESARTAEETAYRIRWTP